MGHPEIENGAPRERYTSDEMWATRPAFTEAGSQVHVETEGPKLIRVVICCSAVEG
jgi:hypothetical protein